MLEDTAQYLVDCMQVMTGLPASLSDETCMAEQRIANYLLNI